MDSCSTDKRVEVESRSKCQVKIAIGSEWAEIRVFGSANEITLSPNDAVKTALRTSQRLLILDFVKVPSLPPQGLMWLEQVSAYAEPKGVRVRLIAQKGSKVKRLLKLMRYDRFLVVVDSYELALRPACADMKMKR